MKSFEDLCKESKHSLRDISNLYPDYAPPIGVNNSISLIAFFSDGEIRYTDRSRPCFEGIDD